MNTYFARCQAEHIDCTVFVNFLSDSDVYNIIISNLQCGNWYLVDQASDPHLYN